MIGEHKRIIPELRSAGLKTEASRQASELKRIVQKHMGKGGPTSVRTSPRPPAPVPAPVPTPMPAPTPMPKLPYQPKPVRPIAPPYVPPRMPGPRPTLPVKPSPVPPGTKIGTPPEGLHKQPTPPWKRPFPGRGRGWGWGRRRDILRRKIGAPKQPINPDELIKRYPAVQ